MVTRMASFMLLLAGTGLQATLTPTISKITDALIVSIFERQRSLEKLQQDFNQAEDGAMSVSLYFDEQGQLHRALTPKEKITQALTQENEHLVDEQNTLQLFQEGVPGILKIIEGLNKVIEEKQHCLSAMETEIKNYELHTPFAIYKDRHGNMRLVQSRKQQLADSIVEIKNVLIEKIAQKEALMSDLQALQAFQLQE